MTEYNELLMGDLLRLRAEQKPDFEVLTFEHLSLDGGATPDEVRTYAQLAEHANSIAARLIELGVERGDRFALMMRNHPEYVESMAAASLSASVFVPIDPRTRGDKLAYFMENAGCRGMICADYCMPALAEIRGSLPNLEWILVLDTNGEAGEVDAAHLIDTLSLGEVIERRVPTVDSRLENPIFPHYRIFGLEDIVSILDLGADIADRLFCTGFYYPPSSLNGVFDSLHNTKSAHCAKCYGSHASVP